MKQNINWGIIGLGNVAINFAEAFKDLKNATLISLSSKNSEKLETYKNKFNIEQEYCFHNYEDLLSCKDIDAVYIALPPSLHYEWIIRSIEKKKNILVEKPATVSVKEIEDVKIKLKDTKLLFTEGLMYRYTPHILKLIELIKSDKIGNLISMESSFGKDILTKKNMFGLIKKKKPTKKNRIYNKDLGGGVILDLGCYPVSLSVLIASTFSQVNCDKIIFLNNKKEIGPTNVDLNSYTELQFENNFVSKVSVSFTKDLGSTTIINGSKGRLIINNTWQTNSTKIFFEDLNNNKQDINFTNGITIFDNIFSYEINSISKSLLDKKSVPDFPGLSIDESVINMKILERWLS